MKKIWVLLAMLMLLGCVASRAFAEVEIVMSQGGCYWQDFTKTLKNVIQAGEEKYVVARKNCDIKVAVECVVLGRDEVRFTVKLYERGKIIKEMMYVTAQFFSAEDAEIKGEKFGRKIKKEVRKIQTTRR